MIKIKYVIHDGNVMDKNGNIRHIDYDSMIRLHCLDSSCCIKADQKLPKGTRKKELIHIYPDPNNKYPFWDR